MKLTTQQREWIEIGSVATVGATVLHYMSASNDLVSDPTNADTQKSAQSARALMFASFVAAGAAWWATRRRS